MADLLDVASRLSPGTYVLWVVWVVAGLGLLFYSGRQLRDRVAGETKVPRQSIDIQNAPGATVYQSGGDIILADPRAIPDIQTLSLEARLTCTLQEGTDVPPSEVDFTPLGDSHAYLEGAGGRERLSFVSPVRFRLLEGDRVTVVNRFALAGGSELQHRPVAALASFGTLSVPIVTVVYGESLAAMTLLEVTLSLNGELIWYAAWEYDVPFQTGPRFTVPLADLHQRIRGE